MKIKIKYYASLREEAGCSEENWETNCKRGEELFEELRQKYHFSLKKDLLRLAINRKYQDFNHEILEGDEVVFIPPVAGG